MHSCHLLVVQHLRTQGLHAQAIQVEQALCSQLDPSKELAFLRNVLVYQGEYQVTLQFLPFFRNAQLDALAFQVKKLWVLDLLVHGSRERDEHLLLMKLLQEIRTEHQQEQEFKSLCFLMTLQDICESQVFQGWNIHQVLLLSYTLGQVRTIRGHPTDLDRGRGTPGEQSLSHSGRLCRKHPADIGPSCQ